MRGSRAIFCPRIHRIIQFSQEISMCYTKMINVEAMAVDGSMSMGEAIAMDEL